MLILHVPHPSLLAYLHSRSLVSTSLVPATLCLGSGTGTHQRHQAADFAGSTAHRDTSNLTAIISHNHEISAQWSMATDEFFETSNAVSVSAQTKNPEGQRTLTPPNPLEQRGFNSTEATVFVRFCFALMLSVYFKRRPPLVSVPFPVSAVSPQPR